MRNVLHVFGSDNTIVLPSTLVAGNSSWILWIETDADGGLEPVSDN